MTHPWFSASSTPRVLAHRGYIPAHSVDLEENTFAALAAAHGVGAIYLESDCHLTRDGEVVLFHDDDLQRVTGDPRKIADVTVRELERLMEDLGGLVTLRQALDAFPDSRFNLDVKAPGAATAVGRAIAPHADRVLVTSFSDEWRNIALEAARAAGGHPATSAGTRTIAQILAAALTGSNAMMQRAVNGVDAVQIPERHKGMRILTRRLIRALHRHDVEVHVWTVNDPADMRRLLAMGVDGLVTDDALTALKVIQKG